MRNDTRTLFNSLRARIAQLSGVESSTESFTVEPSVQQRLESNIQESSEFLSSINIIGVDDIKGEKLGLGISGPIAGRTNVSTTDRSPRDLSTLDPNGYECFSTEFDTFISWSKLDAWAKFPDFQTRVRDAIVQQQALDRIMIGFNGLTAATESNRGTNPLLQDVNIGWLQKYRLNSASRVLSEVVDDSDEITVGTGGDYENLDSLVFDAVNNLVDPWHRESTELVAVMGRQMLADKYFPLISTHSSTPTEKISMDLIISQKRVGGLQAVRAPFFPEGAILITSLQNLSLYWQNGSRRRHMIDNPKRKRIENFETSNDGYVIEDYGFGCLIENITFEVGE